jgi:8-oxo-dGTP diphosphatase
MRIRVVAGAIEEAGQVLCAQRGPDQRHPGLWELPGGKVEPGETDAQALSRELREELGVEVVVGSHLGTSTHDYPDLSIELVAYNCILYSGRPESLEHAEVRWVSPDSLGDLDWAPADRMLVELLSG